MTSTTRRRLIGAALTLFLAVVGTGLLAGPADAGSYVIPQAECSTPGKVGYAKNGERYRCEKREGDTCFRWRWVYRADKPVGSWSPRTSLTPCRKCSPTPSPSTPTATSVGTGPSSSTSPKPSATPAGGPTPSGPGGEDFNHHRTLPVTGPGAAALAIVGAAVVFLGAAALWFGRRGKTQ